MATQWSYSGDPSSSSKDAVRFTVGDTDPSDQIFTDAEVNYSLTTYGSVNEAALSLAKAAVAKYAKLFSSWEEKNGQKQGERPQQKFAQFKALVLELTAQRGRRVVGIYAGGISVADKQTQEQAADRVAPAFRVDDQDRQGPVGGGGGGSTTEGGPA